MIVKVRGWLLTLLFAHVLLHPWVHVMGATSVASDLTTVSRSSVPSSGALISGDRCELCRVGHNATAASPPPKIELLNPRWIRTTLQAVNYASLQAGRGLPARAPPIL
jgi:hypothetical protein